MEINKKKKKRDANDAEREARQDFFSTPVVVTVVACLAVVLGGFHYINKESKTVTEKYELKHEYNSAASGEQLVEPEQDSMESRTPENAIIYSNTETRDSLKLSIVEVHNQKALYPADRETTDVKDDTAQKEKRDYSINQTPSITGINTLISAEDKDDQLTVKDKESLAGFTDRANTLISEDKDGKMKVTDNESLADLTDRTSDGKTVFLVTTKSSSTTGAKEREAHKDSENDTRKESSSNTPPREDKTDSTINTTPDSHHLNTSTNDEQNVKDTEDQLNILPRRNGVKVGYVQKLELEPGKVYDVITRSLRPPIFEIPNFLSEHECKTLIDEATQLGLHKSDVHIEPTNLETFKGWDYDDDGVISPQEVIHTMQDTAYLFFTQEDIEQMFNDLNIGRDGNGVMDLDEYQLVTNGRIVDYLHKLSTKHRRIMHRNSRHTWLHYNNIEGLNDRVSALTKIPIQIIERSEKLQVVHYGPEGHYYCHLDSQDVEKDVPCCRANDKRTCRLCRYITVLYFLNDVEEGGETAFPVADNATFSDQDWAENMKFKCDLSKYCHQANVYVKPRKGTAIMWYNHLRDDETGWLGGLDPRSYHGGCDVIAGHKWIANSWINIIGESHDALVTYHPTADPIP